MAAGHGAGGPPDAAVDAADHDCSDTDGPPCTADPPCMAPNAALLLKAAFSSSGLLALMDACKVEAN